MEKYWIIGFKGDHPGGETFADKEAARQHAERAARMAPGKTVVVYEAVCAASVEAPVPPPCKWEEAVKPSDLPF